MSRSCSKSAHSLTINSVQDTTTLAPADFPSQAMVYSRQHNRSPSYDKLSSFHMGSDSPTGESYCSVGMEKATSIMRSEMAVAHVGISLCNPRQPHSHSINGRTVPSYHNYQSHQLSLSGTSATGYISSSKQKQQRGLKRISCSHEALIHLNSIDQHSTHPLPHSSNTERSNSAGAVSELMENYSVNTCLVLNHNVTTQR